MPAAERAAGLRNPGGPIAGPEFGSALTAVGLWQAVFFIALRGWPVNTITRRPARLLAGNALVIGLGALTYLVLRNLAHWQPDAISAAGSTARSFSVHGHMNVEHEMAGLPQSEISHPARRHIRGVSQPAAQVLDSAASPAAS
jgi:hypothetical protein